MTTVYMIVSRDKYRFPRWWGTSTAELARRSGRSYASTRSAICKAYRNGGRFGGYEVVCIKEADGDADKPAADE